MTSGRCTLRSLKSCRRNPAGKLCLDERLKLESASRHARRHRQNTESDQPSEVWTGRGKQPRWLVAQSKLGDRLDDLEFSRRANAIRTGSEDDQPYPAPRRASIGVCGVRGA
ncbi:H-NS family nucleoid-associated regulatory protein [Bradyrhizobium sp. Lot33]